MRGVLTDDTLITLADACEIVFAGKIKPDSLKKEWREGNLDLCKIGRSYFVSVADVRELKIKCRVEAPARASGSIRKEEPGLSSTVEAAAAQDSLKLTIAAQRKRLATTSRQNTS
jgi:hypothetical protein